MAKKTAIDPCEVLRQFAFLKYPFGGNMMRATQQYYATDKAMAELIQASRAVLGIRVRGETRRRWRGYGWC
jgi:hypothetical protein